jgi:NADH-quinone oxidoreductase subunit M
VDSAVEANPLIGVAVVATAALNGIAVVRAYFLLFTGTRHLSTVSLGIGLRERVAVLTLSALILGGGFYPQPGISTRHRAAEEMLEERKARNGTLEKPRTEAKDNGKKVHAFREPVITATSLVGFCSLEPLRRVGTLANSD